MRGAAVIAQVEAFLDEAIGLERGQFSEITQFALKDVGGTNQLVARLNDGSEVGLADPSKFAGFNERDGELSSVLLKNNQLHIEIQIDRDHLVGKDHPAGVKDVVLESAVTTIQDCEDSVAAVDAEDKTKVYSNWNGIMQGTLEVTFEKDGQRMTRRLDADKTFRGPNGATLTLPGPKSAADSECRNAHVHRCSYHGRWAGNSPKASLMRWSHRWQPYTT